MIDADSILVHAGHNFVPALPVGLHHAVGYTNSNVIVTDSKRCHRKVFMRSYRLSFSVGVPIITQFYPIIKPIYSSSSSLCVMLSGFHFRSMIRRALSWTLVIAERFCSSVKSRFSKEELL